MEHIDWAKKYQEAYDHAQRELDEKARTSVLDSAFFNAAAYAKRAAKNDGFYPEPTEFGEAKFSVQQGLKAACYSREEVAAILVIQRTLVRGINTLIALSVILVVLLAYIALRSN